MSGDTDKTHKIGALNIARGFIPITNFGGHSEVRNFNKPYPSLFFMKPLLHRLQVHEDFHDDENLGGG